MAPDVSALGEGATKYQIGDMVCPIYMPKLVNGDVRRSHAGGSHGPIDGTQCEKMLISGERRRPYAVLHGAEAGSDADRCSTDVMELVEQGHAGRNIILLRGTGGVSCSHSSCKAGRRGDHYIVQQRLARAQELGADHLINYRDNPDWHRSAIEITNGRGVDPLLRLAAQNA